MYNKGLVQVYSRAISGWDRIQHYNKLLCIGCRTWQWTQWTSTDRQWPLAKRQKDEKENTHCELPTLPLARMKKDERGFWWWPQSAVSCVTIRQRESIPQCQWRKWSINQMGKMQISADGSRPLFVNCSFMSMRNNMKTTSVWDLELPARLSYAPARFCSLNGQVGAILPSAFFIIIHHPSSITNVWNSAVSRRKTYEFMGRSRDT